MIPQLSHVPSHTASKLRCILTISISSGVTDTFQIISGCQLPKPKQSNKGEVVDPYVKIRVVGPAVDDNAKNEGKTKSIDNNGFRLEPSVYHILSF